MIRIVVAGFLGAIMLFLWGFFSWAILPLHKTTIHTLSNEDIIVAAFKAGNLETGTYMVPGMAGESEASKKAHSEKMKSGPIAMIHYSTNGYEEVDVMYMLRGFLIEFLAAMMAASLLGKLSWSLASKFGARVRFVLMLGIFLAIATRLSDWAWLGYPAGFTISLIIDDIIGWALAGLVIAWRMKPLMTKTI